MYFFTHSYSYVHTSLEATVLYCFGVSLSPQWGLGQDGLYKGGTVSGQYSESPPLLEWKSSNFTYIIFYTWMSLINFHWNEGLHS